MISEEDHRRALQTAETAVTLSETLSFFVEDVTDILNSESPDDMKIQGIWTLIAGLAD